MQIRKIILTFAAIFAAPNPAGASTGVTPIPFMESWKGGEAAHGGWTLPDNGLWRSAPVAEGLTDSDSDGGLLLFECGPEGGEGVAVSPRISLCGAPVPMLELDVAVEGEGAHLSVVAMTASDERMALDVVPEPGGAWGRVSLPLYGFSSCEWLTVSLAASSETGARIRVDNLTINAPFDRDLALLGVEWPEGLRYGLTSEVTVKVMNNGHAPSRDYYIEVTDSEGATVGSLEQRWIAPGGVVTRCVPVSPEAGWDAEKELTVRIVSADDELLANNVSESCVIPVEYPELPAVTDLGGASCGYHAVELVWSAPVVPEPETVAMTEDVERYDDFAVSGALEERGWMLHDGAGGPTCLPLDPVTGLEVEHPGFGSPHAFMVLNSGKAGLSLYNADGTPSAWMPHSGDRCLAAMRNAEGRNDGWLISPELTSMSQTVSFYVKSALAAMPETYEFLYSATGRNLTDFVRAATRVATAEWTKVDFNLPRGARYFAIRCTSTNAMALLLDDIRCVTLSSMPEDMLLMGYNVWRDGSMVNTEPVTAHSYLDFDVEEGDHLYCVTALYSLGESAPSNEVKLTSALAVVEAGECPEIRVVAGGVRVTGAAGMSVRVWTLAGTLAAEAPDGADAVIGLAPGIYIVTAGGHAAKAVVKG